jgi:hypothetical protein
MATHEIFDSSLRKAGDLAGVFEYDGETAYFYLYATEGEHGTKVLDSIHVLSGEPDFTERDIAIRWDLGEQKVGLFIRNVLWAVFDSDHRRKYGGDYRPGARPTVPPEAESGFGMVS